MRWLSTNKGVHFARPNGGKKRPAETQTGKGGAFAFGLGAYAISQEALKEVRLYSAFDPAEGHSK